jgi:hypothetical protein
VPELSSERASYHRKRAIKLSSKQANAAWAGPAAGNHSRGPARRARQVAFMSPRRPIIPGARRGLAFRRSTPHCTSIRTSGVATSEKCLQIGVRKIIGAESHPLRRAQCLFRSHSRHSACVPITSGLPRKGDIFRARRTSHLCHNEHPNGIRHERSTWRAGARGRSAKRIGTVSARRA